MINHILISLDTKSKETQIYQLKEPGVRLGIWLLFKFTSGMGTKMSTRKPTILFGAPALLLKKELGVK